MDPQTLSLILSGAGAISGMLPHHPMYRTPNIQPFRFNPDPNDPQLALMRSRALRQGGMDYANTTNEVGRAGLLGSSAGFAELGASQNRANQSLEDVDNGVFGHQREEQFGQYGADNEMLRHLGLLQGEGDVQAELASRAAGLKGLESGGLGKILALIKAMKDGGGSDVPLDEWWKTSLLGSAGKGGTPRNPYTDHWWEDSGSELGGV